MNQKLSICITGIGVILPNTSSVDKLWHNLAEGKSQVDFINRFDTSKLNIKIAAQVEDFDYLKFLPNLPEKHAQKYSREMLIVMSALENAKRDAGIDKYAFEPERMGFVESTSRGTLNWWYKNLDQQAATSDVSCFDSNGIIPSLNGTTATMSAIYSNIRGLVTTISSACVGGHHALSLAMKELYNDSADVMFIGGHDFPIIPPIIDIYSSEGSCILSKESKNPQNAMKPYDINRDGFVLGEGAVVLCIEKTKSAIKRGANIYCEVLGHYALNEAGHATTMDLSGEFNAHLLKGLLNLSNRSCEDVSYYCAHGTATKYNDIAESRTLNHIYDNSKRPPLGSIKPIYGHLLGGAGILNVAASALMIKKQTLCPTINIEKVDPECNHDHVVEGQRKGKVNTIVSMSYAIGSQGSMVALGELL